MTAPARCPLRDAVEAAARVRTYIDAPLSGGVGRLEAAVAAHGLHSVLAEMAESRPSAPADLARDVEALAWAKQMPHGTFCQKPRDSGDDCNCGRDAALSRIAAAIGAKP